MSLFVLGESEMALSESEKITRKSKVEAKCYKCITGRGGSKLYNSHNEKRPKHYAGAKQKKKGRKPSKKVIKAQRLK